MILLLLCLLIGVVAGLRAMTPLATICWGAYLGWLRFAGTSLGFVDHKVTVIIFTLLAIGEIFNDKLPKTPARTAIPSLIARVVSGACSASALAISAGSGLIGPVIAGIVGALIGTYGGYNIRHSLVAKANLPDFVVALMEDVVAIVGGLLIASRV
jgi:uncharacterized membrane protein